MVLPIIILFVIAPLAEIYVLLAASDQFGLLPVLLTCVVTAVVGGILLRIQGLRALQEAQKALASGDAPVMPLVDGLFLAICAPLMMTPGFITDALGFALLIPPVRRAIARYAGQWLKRKADENGRIITIRRR